MIPKLWDSSAHGAGFLSVRAKLLREHRISRYRLGDKIPSYKVLAQIIR